MLFSKNVEMKFLITLLLTVFLGACQGQNQEQRKMVDHKQLKDKLTDMQYYVTQQKGTERPYTGQYWDFFESGVYHCVVCDKELFESDSKFASSCGWPSFIDSKYKDNIKFQVNDWITGTRLQDIVTGGH